MQNLRLQYKIETGCYPCNTNSIGIPCNNYLYERSNTFLLYAYAEWLESKFKNPLEIRLKYKKETGYHAFSGDTFIHRKENKYKSDYIYWLEYYVENKREELTDALNLLYKSII
jgi:hypothetical protein